MKARLNIRGGVAPLALVAVLAMGGGGVALANRAQDAEARREKVAQELGLTEAQKSQLENLRAETKSKVKAMRESGADRSEICDAMKDAKTKGQSVLTEEQRAKMTQLREQAQQARAAAMQEKLGLSDQQMAEIKQMREQLKTQMEALRNNTDLTAEQKRTELRQLADQSRERFRATLTEEQRQRIETLRNEARASREGTGRVRERLQRLREGAAQRRNSDRPTRQSPISVI